MNMQQKSIAVMQPYVFPYIGYFQLINAVDTFVFYDDVNFIKRGWINRNKILINKKEKLISFPCIGASQNKLINEVSVDLKQKQYSKILKTIEFSYKNSPNFEHIFPLIKEVFNVNSENIGDWNINGIKVISDYLEINTTFKTSSYHYLNSKGLEKAERLKKISLIEKANQYVNAIGGMSLYDKDDFMKSDIKLNFLKPSIDEYKQFGNDFVPGLSIIDVLMFNSKEDVKQMINRYELI